MCDRLQDRLRRVRTSDVSDHLKMLTEEAARRIDELTEALISLEQQATAHGVTLTQRSGSSSDWANDT